MGPDARAFISGVNSGRCVNPDARASIYGKLERDIDSKYDRAILGGSVIENRRVNRMKTKATKKNCIGK